MTTTLRTATLSDYSMLAVLHNATHEPHFHVTSERLASRDARPSDGLRGRFVVAIAGEPVGMASYTVQDFDRSDRVWVDLSIHPDRLRDDTAQRLIDAVIEQSRLANATSLWVPIREDYLEAWPELLGLEFKEVHRTFGGGFVLTDARDYSRHHSVPTQLRSLDQAREDDATQAQQLFALVHTDKVTAAPTVTQASDQLDLADIIAPASFLAVENDECIGLCLAAPSPLGAWLSVIAVHPEHRRRGIAGSLLAATLTALREQEVAFLNTAGVRRDDAYLGLLRSLGAAIEPDWISFERDL